MDQTLRHGATSFPVRTIHVEVIQGPDAGLRVVADTLAIGTAEGSTLRLTDPSVSRFHVTLQASPTGVHVVDHGSTNGTFAAGIRIERAVLPAGTSRRPCATGDRPSAACRVPASSGMSSM